MLKALLAYGVHLSWKGFWAKPTSTVLKIHVVFLEFFVILGQKFLQGPGVRQVCLQFSGVKGHFSLF